MTYNLKKSVNHIEKRLKENQEVRMIVQIGEYDMDYIRLDLRTDVNILTRQTWESMNKPQ